MSEKILLIEDDLSLFKGIKNTVEELGYSLEQELDGEAGLKRGLVEDFALVIVDGNLPKLNGFDVCRKLREAKKNLPIIMLTSRVEEVDRVLGIELGADDYITKPFSLRELSARIKSIIRRFANSAQLNTTGVTAAEGYISLNFGNLQINDRERKVILRGKKVDLTNLEYGLLLLLASNPGKVFTREELKVRIWNLEVQNYDPTITVTIGRLRNKIEEDPNFPKLIETVRGIGYRFADPRK